MQCPFVAMTKTRHERTFWLGLLLCGVNVSSALLLLLCFAVGLSPPLHFSPESRAGRTCQFSALSLPHCIITSALSEAQVLIVRDRESSSDAASLRRRLQSVSLPLFSTRESGNSDGSFSFSFLIEIERRQGGILWLTD